PYTTLFRSQGALDPPSVPAGKIDAENRFVHACGAAFIPPHCLAPPFGAPPAGLLDPRPRHRERRRPQAGGQRPVPRAMTVALTLLANARGLRCAQSRIELFLHQLLDRLADPLAHRLLDAVAAEERNLFLVACLLGTVLHRVILRHPPPSGRSSLNRNCAG